ncbi:MAG: S-layer homology domain-containing protein, partial [Clostridia bacterium]|nr:S-layer homology domain-containing protein [Clostridia bacterium]
AFTLTVNVVEKKIIDMKVYGTSPAFSGTKELNGSEEYNATEDLTITKVDVQYNTDKGNWNTKGVAATTSNMKLDIIHTDSSKSRLDIKTMTADLIGDDDYLKYTYTDPTGLTYTSTVDLHVTTSDVVSVVVEKNPGPAIIDEKEITPSALYQRFTAIVTLKEHEEKLYYAGTSAAKNSKFTIKFYEDSQNKAELSSAEVADSKIFKEAFFTVQYEDAIWKSSDSGLRVKDFFDMFEQVPEYVSINWDNAVYTEYYEGYVIGSDPKDWKGVVVTVTYEEVEEPVVYDSIDEIVALDLVLSPIVAREKYVTIESILGYDMGIASNLPTGFTLLYREVMSITINAGTQKYTEGDKLDLSKVKATLKYNYGDPVTGRSITNDEFTCSPKNGTKLTADMDEVLVVYKDPNTGKEVSASFAIQVAASSGSIKEVVLVSDGAKDEYFIGEALEKDGYRLFVIYKDNTPSKYVNLSDCSSVTISDSSVYKNNAFQKAYTGSLTISFKLPKSVDASDTIWDVTMNSIKVIKRPLLTSITATSEKAQYLEGEAPKVHEFTITAKYDDGNQRVFKVSDTETGAAKTSYTITENGVKYTVKLTPTMIDEDTDSIRVSYTEQVTVGTKTTTTKYDDVKIDVAIPDAVLTYYNTTDKMYLTEAFEDLYDALERAETIAASYTGTNTSRIPSIELRRDVTMTSDYAVDKSLEIDLNGHTLTMIRGAVYVATKASVSVEVTFTNSSKTAGKLVYSSKDEDTVIIVQNDEYVIDRDSDDAGKYAVTITTPKNGKVTGPKEVTHGHDAQFTITPNDGYTISTIKVNNKNVAVPNDGKLTVENVQAKVTVTVTFAEKAWDNPFTDVSKSATYYKSIQFVYENGLFTGMSATKFEPNTTMTRAMFVTVLGRLAGIDADAAASRYGYTSDFKDVSSTDQSIKYAIPYIKWASDNGLIEGYGNGKFGPKDEITHAQMYVLMERYASYIEKLNTNAAGTNIAVNDKKDIPDWAYDAVEYAAKNSYLITSSNRLTPNASAKRSELAMLLDKFCANVLGD